MSCDLYLQRWARLGQDVALRDAPLPRFGGRGVAALPVPALPPGGGTLPQIEPAVQCEMTEGDRPRGPDHDRLKVFLPEFLATRAALSDPRFLLAFALSALSITFAYLLLLPTLALNVSARYFGLWVLSFLTPTEELVAIAMGVLIGLIVVLSLFLRLRCGCTAGAPAGAGGVAGVVLNAMGSMICCGILVPLVLSLVASGAVLTTDTFQARQFFEAYSPEFYLLSGVVLWGSVRSASRRVLKAPRSRRSTRNTEGPCATSVTPGTDRTDRSGEAAFSTALSEPEGLR